MSEPEERFRCAILDGRHEVSVHIFAKEAERAIIAYRSVMLLESLSVIWMWVGQKLRTGAGYSLSPRTALL